MVNELKDMNAGAATHLPVPARAQARDSRVLRMDMEARAAQKLGEYVTVHMNNSTV